MANESELGANWDELEEYARGWGKLLAKLVFPAGVGLDVDLWMMEEAVTRASRALVSSAIETMTTEQAETLEGEASCPNCGQSCRLDHRSRAIQVRGGTAKFNEPVAHCSVCRRDFFPSAASAEA